MKKKIGILGGLWLFFSLWNFLAPGRTFSEAENRYLTERPRVTAGAIASGAYMKDFESWMSDQLLFRDGFVGLKAATDKLLGQRESGGVYLGRDGYLLEEFQTVDEARLKKNAAAVAGFLERMEEEGVKGQFLLVPTGAFVMEEKLPPFAPEISQKELFEKLREEIPGVLGADEALKAARTEAGGELYYRTDHHWTSLGAFSAYQAFCKEEGRELPKLSDYESRILSKAFYGTSYAKAGLYSVKPDTMTAMQKRDGVEVLVDYGTGEPEHSLYDESFLSKRDKYRVFLKGNYPLTRIKTSNHNGKRLLLIKDSYANTFVQFLVEDYEEIHMVDPRAFKESLTKYAKEQGVTEVLFLYQIKNFAEDTALAGIHGM